MLNQLGKLLIAAAYHPADSCYSNVLAYLPALISADDDFNVAHIYFAPNVRDMQSLS